MTVKRNYGNKLNKVNKLEVEKKSQKAIQAMEVSV